MKTLDDAIELQGFIECMLPPPAPLPLENPDPQWSPRQLAIYRAGRERGTARCTEIIARAGR